MTRIPEISNNLQKLPDVLKQYEDALDGVDDILAIKGKRLEQANQENAAWQHYFDNKRTELKSIVDYLESRVEQTRGKLFKSYTESSQRDLSDRAKNQYINNEKAYLDMYELYLEANEVYKKYQATVEAFTTRGYALNNITKLRVASLEDVVI